MMPRARRRIGREQAARRVAQAEIDQDRRALSVMTLPSSWTSVGICERVDLLQRVGAGVLLPLGGIEPLVATPASSSAASAAAEPEPLLP